MAGESIEVEGLAELGASFDRLARQLEDLAPPGAVQIIGAEAQRRAPKRTGRLAASFSGTSGRGESALSFGAEYAGAVHFGVGPRPGLRGPHNIRPSLFLWGAARDLQAEWLEEYADQTQDLVDQVKGA